VRVTYGYDPTSGKLSSITTPEGSVYGFGYDAFGRISYVDLPDPVTGAASACGLAHCWQFAYAEGIGQATLTDPRGNAWVYKALGSGSLYELKDPLGNTLKRTWTGDQNKASEIDQLGNTTLYEYL
jgi:YD repeat-containing protein